MTWTWGFDPEVDDPDLAAEAADGWAAREDAESWLRLVYADLADAGVVTVTLLDDGAPVYSMGLDEAE